MVGKLWWPTVQRDYFSVDIRRPKNGILVEKSSQLWRLDAFQDDDGLLRMRGHQGQETLVNNLMQNLN
ncbi:unnamed protein product [Allacma fusca]|uniref:Uncharacterized protein n=1 Tax=Allacma fusca TaxID=39272 RepID=A0A8J2LC88_9HEXA|nr:unnamed protein product [Allacma fusca]